jgi:hypothetical protein
MAKMNVKVGIVVISRKPVTRWATRGYVPSAVLPDVPDIAPGTLLGPPGDLETYFAGAFDLMLHSGDTAHYRDNLQSGRPSLWVLMRADGTACDVTLVTADPYEGEGAASDPGLIVEMVPMPDRIRKIVQAFFDAHHVEQTFFKRKRKKADLDALSRGGQRILGVDEDAS